MELSKNQKCQVSSKSKNLKSLAPTIKCLVSLLLFSVSLYCSSLLGTLILDLIELISYNVNKSYVFLLFNGILVLLKIYHGVGISVEAKRINAQDQHLRGKEFRSSETQEVVLLEEEVIVEEKEIMHCIKDKSLVIIRIGGEEKALISNELEREKRNQNGNVDEDGNKEIGSLSLEELNKKFDDFIRRMKEGIKTEAQTSLFVNKETITC